MSLMGDIIRLTTLSGRGQKVMGVVKCALCTYFLVCPGKYLRNLLSWRDKYLIVSVCMCVCAYIIM